MNSMIVKPTLLVKIDATNGRNQLAKIFCKTIKISIQARTPSHFIFALITVFTLLHSTLALGVETVKQISYPVPLQIQHTTASSSVAAVVSAPQPTIRPIDQAFSTPPQNVKKTDSNKVKPNIAKTIKVATVKPAAVKKGSLTKTTVTSKATSAPKTKKTTTKKIAAKKIVKTQPTAMAMAKTREKTSVTSSTPNAAISTATLAAVLPSVSRTVEENVTNNAPQILNTDPATNAAVQRVFDDEPIFFDEPESMESDEQNKDQEALLTTATMVEPVSASNNTIDTAATEKNVMPLPMTSQKENFVAEFEKYVETKIAPKVPGVAVAIIANGKVSVLKSYGVKKVGSRDTINNDTLFRLASVSKTIGSAAGALLVRDGLVRWDTRLTTVLPTLEFSNPKYADQLTISNILSQSTGLPTHTNDNYIEEGLSYDEVVRRLRYVNFVCPPGKCYGYQNVTYSLIGKVVLKKTGKTYEDFVQERIFNPLGMRTASFGLDALKANNNYALPHVATSKGWSTQKITEHYYRINPAAGANASITDMSHWLLAQMGHNPDVFSPATLNALHDKVTRNTPAQNHYGTREGVTNSHYGLGWRVFDYRGDKNFIHHGGYVLGFRSEMVINPELQIGMIILSNSNRLAGNVIFHFLDAYEDNKRGKRALVPPSLQWKKKK